MTGAHELDRRVQVLRQATADDGFTSAAGDFAVYGAPLWAARRDVSDGERWRAGEIAAVVMTRFRVRRSSFTAGIAATDRLICDGLTFEIVGLKEIGRREWIEITGTARTET